MQVKKITPWTDTRRPETEIDRIFTMINNYKADKQSKIYTNIKLSDLEEREGALLSDSTGLYRVYRYNNKLYKQKFEEV